MERTSLSQVARLAPTDPEQTDSYEVPRITLRIVREGTLTAARDTIRNPAKVYDMLKDRLADRDREVFAVIHIDARNKVLSVEETSIGNINEMHITLREIFKGAILVNAVAIVVAHNRPSSDVTPSPEDIELTKQVVAAGKLLGMECLDHVILGGSNFLSLRERGLGFN